MVSRRYTAISIRASERYRDQCDAYNKTLGVESTDAGGMKPTFITSEPVELPEVVESQQRFWVAR